MIGRMCEICEEYFEVDERLFNEEDDEWWLCPECLFAYPPEFYDEYYD